MFPSFHRSFQKAWHRLRSSESPDCGDDCLLHDSLHCRYYILSLVSWFPQDDSFWGSKMSSLHVQRTLPQKAESQSTAEQIGKWRLWSRAEKLRTEGEFWDFVNYENKWCSVPFPGLLSGTPVDVNCHHILENAFNSSSPGNTATVLPCCQSLLNGYCILD
jgi:hypothetical protein